VEKIKKDKGNGRSRQKKLVQGWFSLFSGNGESIKIE